MIVDLYSFQNLSIKIKEITKEYKTAPPDVLVAIGLDRVIFHPTYLPFQIENIYQHKEILKEIAYQLTEEQRYLLYNLFTKKGPLELTEPCVGEVLSLLQKENIKIIGLTAYLVGPIDTIPNNESWGFSLLKNHFKLDFAKAFKDVTDIELTEEPLYRGRYPRYYKGILHANGRGERGSKGHALVSFFKRLKHNPKLLFVIDDIETHLILLEETVKKNLPPIKVVGIHYKYGEIGYPERRIDAAEFRSAWVKLAEEAKSMC